MKKTYLLSILLVFAFSLNGFAQTADSIQRLNNLEMITYRKTIPLLEITTSAAQINRALLQINNSERILESVNIIPGVKMEERSPGSYRISVRGSTLRSPFGVRNVKIYFDDFILTDASGNSYLNSISPNFIQNISILKGPQGGEFGSETGGTILLQTQKHETTSLDISGGNYSQFAQNFNFSKTLGNHFLEVGQSYYDSESYREQSKVKRKSFYIKDLWNYVPNNELKFMLLYTDLHYQTPGGLTLQQMLINRRQARLATATLPSATQQNAGIYNTTLLTGISHDWAINEKWNQFTLIQSSYTDFKNPFISNYEVRYENNYQGRFYLNYKNKIDNLFLQTRVGLETGISQTSIRNFDNLNGIKDNKQSFDNLKSSSTFYYLSQHFAIANKIYIDASLSYNSMYYHWENLFPNVEVGKIRFKNQLLPNVALNYKLNSKFAIRGKIAKGTSAPTTEEVRSGNQIIANNLVPEYGWNKEFGVRKNFNFGFIEAAIFDYNLKDAIVKRQDYNGNDYFINSGGTSQTGIEFSIETKKLELKNKFFKEFKTIFSGTYSDFKYNHYLVNTTNYSGNILPGISKWMFQSVLNLNLINNFNINLSHYYTGKQFLNDANTVFEDDFIVGNIKLEKYFYTQNFKTSVYLGINNLYNSKYSLGYDVNAFGNRFYNPAATTNFYIGTTFKL